MSNLAKYKGNFLDYADQEFKQEQGNEREFHFKNLTSIFGIDIDVSSDVGVFPADTNSIIIELDTDSPNDFEVYESNGYIYIKQIRSANSNATVINIGGRTIISNNFNFGETFVNGVRVDNTGNDGKEVKEYPHKIKIFCPPGLNLESKMNGCSILVSKVIFDQATVTVSGVSSVGLAAKFFDLNIAGQSDSYIVMKGGDLSVSVSGQGKVQVKGDYFSAKVNVSGMGSVITNGICSGDYRADVSGMGSIVHQGIVLGRIKEFNSGISSISIRRN